MNRLSGATRQLLSHLLIVLPFCTVLAPTPAQQQLNTNLLQGADFEAGIVGWTVTRGQFAVTQYATASAPPARVSVAIGGGTQFLHCTDGLQPCTGCEGYGNLEQSFDVSGNALDIDAGQLYVALAGYFGGKWDWASRTTLRARYFNAAGGELSVPYVDPTLPIVDQTNRNYESTLLAVAGSYQIPTGTRTLTIQLIAWRGSGGNGYSEAWADNVSAKLVRTPTPIPLPLDTNILDVHDFEGPSVVNPATVNGGRVTRGSFGLRLYGGSVAPTLLTAQAIGGGSQFLNANDTWQPCTGCEGYAVITQDFDVGGHASDIDQGRLHVTLAGAFGGARGWDSRTTLRASYFNAGGGALSVPFVDPTLRVITRTNRNDESILLANEQTFPIPSGTRRLRVEFLAWKGSGGSGYSEAWADNLSAKLVLGPAPNAPQIGANLIDNSGFEIGTILSPPATSGWRVTRGNFQAQPYGLPGLPVPSVSASIGGGAFLARATGDISGRASMEQIFDVIGHAALIDTSQLSLDLEGHLGGAVNDADSCYLIAYYYSAFGALLGQDQVGPVSQNDRGNLATLLFRRGTFLLPIGTRTIIVEANMQRVSGGSNDGFLDNARAALVPSGIAVRHPGTGDDFWLGTGVNALPSGGPGRDLKIALTRDILSIEVRSPAGAFHWQPLILAGNVFVSGGSVPNLGVPNLHINPAFPPFFWLLDGTSPIGPFGPSIVIPGGNHMSFVVPPGLTGYSMLLQALTVGSNATNGVYATSDAHEVRFQ